MAIGHEPKPKKIKSKEEAALELVAEFEFSFYHAMFSDLKQSDPDIARQLKPDFDELIKVETEMAQKHPKGDYSINDIKKKIPNNRWIKFVKQIVSRMVFNEKELGEEATEDEKNEFNVTVEKRMKGKDIN